MRWRRPVARRSRAEAQAERDAAEAVALAGPNPSCSVCGAPAFIPCCVCGADLCAAHGYTRLLVSHCAACASTKIGVSSTFSSLPTARRDNVSDVQPVDNAEDDPMATKKAKASKTTGDKGRMTKWGRLGTASEMYKRLIMDQRLGNAACYEHVKKALGPKKAGKPTYAGWYRAKLKSDGVKNVPESK